MSKYKYILLFLPFWLILLLSAEEKDKGSSINQKCLSCHSLESECDERFRIDEKNYSSSVHSHLECKDCHWAVGWGSAVMVISGFFMWNVELPLSLFPLWVHDILVIVHGYEAMLAFLAVII